MQDPTRRGLLFAGLGTLGAAAAAGATADFVRGPQHSPANVESPSNEPGSSPADDEPDTYPFHGQHQAGVVTPQQAFATFLALDLLKGASREDLARIVRVWTDDAARLTQAAPSRTDLEPEVSTTATRLTVTVGFGPTLFDKLGLESQRPDWFADLPAFAIDELDDAFCGGDVLLQVCGDDPTVMAHAERLLTQGATSVLTPRWRQHGFRGPKVDHGHAMRNLFGQVDGTEQPDVEGAQPHLLWCGDDSPAWLRGGTSLVLRRIRMDLDGWDKIDRHAREFSVGRTLDTGAPLTGGGPHDAVDLSAKDELGLTVVGPVAHVRRAAATAPHERFLRRPFSYTDPGRAGTVEAGLLFATYQANIKRQFVPVQERLAEADMLNEWTTPVGSAVFLLPPGATEGHDLAEALLQA